MIEKERDRGYRPSANAKHNHFQTKHNLSPDIASACVKSLPLTSALERVRVQACIDGRENRLTIKASVSFIGPDDGDVVMFRGVFNVGHIRMRGEKHRITK